MLRISQIDPRFWAFSAFVDWGAPTGAPANRFVLFNSLQWPVQVIYYTHNDGTPRDFPVAREVQPNDTRSLPLGIIRLRIRFGEGSYRNIRIENVRDMEYGDGLSRIDKSVRIVVVASADFG